MSNTLSYRTTTENGLSFDLFVDGRPLPELIQTDDAGIPYWDVEGDLPYYPPHGTPRDPDARIVCVCSCGEYGCGHTRCRVRREPGVVIWSDFVGTADDGCQHTFRFSRPDYERVVSDIVQEASAEKARKA